MVILGIDPGTATTGYGAITATRDGLKVLDHGVISTPPGKSLHLRLEILNQGLAVLFARFEPPEVAVEQLFFTNNAKTALAVGQARGVALLAAAKAGCEVHEYTPLQVKQAVVGYGRAEKSQVQYMVKAILALKETPKPDDAADALALAICHAHSRDMRRRETGGARGEGREPRAESRKSRLEAGRQ